MSLIQTSKFHFDIPDSWVDRSVLVWSAPAGSALLPPNFVIANDEKQPGEALVAYVNRQIASLKESLENWQLVSQVETVINGASGYEVIFTWKTPAAAMKQRQIFCELDGKKIVSIGCTAMSDHFAEADETYFRKILNSFGTVQ